MAEKRLELEFFQISINEKGEDMVKPRRIRLLEYKEAMEKF
jgi:hypothetical protein